jgi:hypothetical protein
MEHYDVGDLWREFSSIVGDVVGEAVNEAADKGGRRELH